MTLHILRRKLFTPFVLILLLSGCAVGPDFKAPVAQVPDGQYRLEASVEVGVPRGLRPGRGLVSLYV